MNQHPPASPPSKDRGVRAEPARRPLEPAEVAKALAAIRSDSQRSPEIYLRDTVVPSGGE